MQQAIKDAIARELKAAREIADLAEKENRDLTGEEQGKVKGHFEAATKHRQRGTDQDEMRKQLTDLGDGIGYDAEPGEKQSPEHYALTKGTSLGKMFTESDAYKNLIGSVPGGRFGEKSRVQSQPFGVKALVTGVSETSAGSLVDPQRLGMLDPFYQRPLSLRQLVTSGRITTDAVEYVKLTSVTNNAAPVAEATTAALPTQDGTTGALINAAGGGYKPESAMVFAKETATVKTIAHWIPATKRALADAAQVQTLIDAFLTYGLEEELEDQILTGDGTGENFDGLDTLSGIQETDPPTGTDTIFDLLRRAYTMVQVGGRSKPTAYVMNPLDWEKTELLKDGDDNYIGGGPWSLRGPGVWGLPVVISEAVDEGFAWCADWKKAVLWDREQASISISDSHADFYVRNLVAILAESRHAFGVLRPSAFVKIDLTP